MDQEPVEIWPPHPGVRHSAPPSDDTILPVVPVATRVRDVKGDLSDVSMLGRDSSKCRGDPSDVAHEFEPKGDVFKVCRFGEVDWARYRHVCGSMSE